jgi:hypothetical protein
MAKHNYECINKRIERNEHEALCSIVEKDEGSCAFAYVPKTRIKTITILGTISPYGVINIKEDQGNQSLRRRER